MNNSPVCSVFCILLYFSYASLFLLGLSVYDEVELSTFILSSKSCLLWNSSWFLGCFCLLGKLHFDGSEEFLLCMFSLLLK